jgi:hypothetical protein
MGFREANMTGRVAPETEIAVLDVTPVFDVAICKVEVA